jgi:predicted negative regulator of RcsB-dependent stress response
MSKQEKKPVVVESQDPAERLLAWLKKNQRLVIGAASVLVIAAAGVWFVLEYQGRKEAAAQQALEQARYATRTGNLPLAATDLSRLMDSYRGTAAASEAVILLGQVRLLQDEPTLAAEELRNALQRGVDPQFEAGAYGLLGTALENVGNLTEAARQYERASGAAWYDFQRASYLNDAGRAYVEGGDTTNALGAYQRVVDEFPEAPAAIEAEVRIGEIEADLGGAPGNTG